MQDWISSWRGTLLSSAGRRILIQSITDAIPLYWLEHNTVPRMGDQSINRTNSAFLWLGTQNRHGIHPIAWEIVTRSITEWGLAIRALQTQSRAQITQLMWHFITNHYLLGLYLDPKIPLLLHLPELHPHSEELPPLEKDASTLSRHSGPPALVGW